MPGSSPAVLHDGSGFASLKFGLQDIVGMKPNAIAEHNTTPMGWKTESTARRKRRFCGRNSSVMVVSIGMLPPTPKPTKAVRTRKVLYVLEAPRQRPNMEEKRQVRLKAHLLPVGAKSSQSQWTDIHAVLNVRKRGLTNHITHDAPEKRPGCQTCAEACGDVPAHIISKTKLLL